jgi:methionyl-tRNA synthetase
MAKRRFLVTSGLPYSNGRLHVGHLAGAYLPADIYVRYLRARGDDVRFICGSDDNGVASLVSAREEDRTVEELTAHYHARQREDFRGMGIEFDIFGGTHQPEFVELHNRISQGFFRSIHEKGYFVKRRTKQLYDAQAGQFLPDRYVKGKCKNCGYPDAYGDQCESCGVATEPTELIDPVSKITGTTPELRETTHWYLQLQRFEGALREWLESKRSPGADGPAWRETVLNFVLGQIKKGLPERAMTRDLAWGVPVPLDDPDAAGKVLYVWFDAPIGYVSFTAKLCEREEGDWRQYEAWWKSPDCRIIHFIGEDNTVFHAEIWPAMLMAEGTFQLPSQVVANAFMNIKPPGEEEQKVSKSRGNAVWIEEYLQDHEPDPLRYYLTAIAPETNRTAFDMDDLIQRNNAELLGALGNFVNRVSVFARRYFEGRVPAPGRRDATDQEHLEKIRACAEAVTANLEGYRFKAALGEIMGLARNANAYFNAKEPWAQRKRDPAACGTTIYVCLHTVKALTILGSPFLPFTGKRCAAMLGLAPEDLSWSDLERELSEGHRLGEPQLLFRPYGSGEDAGK